MHCLQCRGIDRADYRPPVFVTYQRVREVLDSVRQVFIHARHSLHILSPCQLPRPTARHSHTRMSCK